MNWYKRAMSRSFIGDCITGLEDPHFQETLGVYDATDLAQLVANGTQISFERFLTILGFDIQYNNYWEHGVEGNDIDYNSIEYDIDSGINIREMQRNPENFEFYFSPEKNVIWFENLGEGVEYFYA